MSTNFEPENLFKFFSLPADKTASLNDQEPNNIIRVLEEKQLWFSNPKTFNDPFDSKFHIRLSRYEKDKFIKDTQKIQQAKLRDHLEKEGIFLSRSGLRHKMNKDFVSKFVPHKFVEDLSLNKVVCCFASQKTNKVEEFLRRDSILMWSHYANNHYGFMVQFKPLDRTFPNALSTLASVNYMDDFPVLNRDEVQLIYDAFSGVKVDLKALILMEKLYTRKSTIWQYENEYRNIQNFDDTGLNLNNTGRVFPFDVDQIVNVFLGCQINTAYIDQIKQVLKQHSNHPQIYKMKMHKDRYELYKDEIPY